jgi:6,7-dimethyl-8-ribityllumazine synthase
MKTSCRTDPVIAIPRARIAVLQANWYREYTDRMVQKFIETITPAEPHSIDRYLASGSLEIPLTARRILRLGKNYEALVVFAVIVKGDTYHFDIVLNECARGISQVMLQEDVPIISEVLPVDSLALVEERSQDDCINKGYHAAYAAAETIAWRRAHPEVSRLD